MGQTTGCQIKLKPSCNLNAIKLKWDFVDHEEDGVEYLLLGELDTVMINKKTREITHAGMSLGLYTTMTNLFHSLNMLDVYVDGHIIDPDVVDPSTRPNTLVNR
jgi:hypothetical protein